MTKLSTLASLLAACWGMPLLGPALAAQPGLPVRPFAPAAPAVAPAVATNAPAAAAPQPPRLLDVTEVAAAAQAALSVMGKIQADLASDPAVVRSVRNRLAGWEVTVPENAQKIREVIRRTQSMTNLEEHKDSWLSDMDAIKTALASLTKHTQQVGADLGKIEQLRELWQSSIEALKKDAPEEALSQAGKILQQLDGLADASLLRRNEAVVLQSRLADIEQVADGVVKDIELAHAQLESQLLSLDAPPLWQALWEDRSNMALGPVLSEARALGDSFQVYYEKNRTRFNLQWSLMAASVLLTFLLRRSAVSFQEQTRKAQAVALLLQRPITMGLIVAFTLNPLIHPRTVLGFRMFWAPVVVFLVVRLLWVLVEPPARRGLVMASIFYFVDNARGLLWNAPTLERLVLLIEAVAAIACLRFVPPTIITNPRARRLWSVLRKVLVLLLGGGAFCMLIGFSGLGRLLVYATVRAPLMACGHLAIYHVLVSTLAVAMLTPAAKHVRMVARHPNLVAHYAERAIAILVSLVFLNRLLMSYFARDPALKGLAKVLSASLTVGSLSISLGDVLAFGLALWLAFKISQFIRFVFEEDIFPRMHLPRGVPYAASSAIHYAILLLGFFAAIMAAGVDMSRLTLLGGAVGLGVGFGLQNIVNNFVSGLILLFERPIQVGDRIEVGTTTGQVQRIGIRSSTVRTFDGAEVIVPNSELIANKLTNWTLSDQCRRIKVTIGVKYGTDPQRVLELLLRVGREHGDILQQPKPEAFFRAHGESSLDFELSVWTDRASEWVRIQSELTVALNRLLAVEGIEVPFPQRDLHLRSSDVPWPAASPASPPRPPAPPSPPPASPNPAPPAGPAAAPPARPQPQPSPNVKAWTS